MSESGEKQFAPTPSRIAKAKREGSVPHAPEFAANASFAAAAGTAVALTGLFAAAFGTAFHAAVNGRIAFGACVSLLACALVPAFAAALAGVTAAALQHGSVHLAPVSCRLERINPFEGFKRICSRETVSHVARAAVAFICCGVVLVPALRAVALAGTTNGMRAIASGAWSGTQRAVFSIVAVASVFAIAEYAVARTSWLKKLRMTFAEYKRELKEQDGDASLRGRRRSLHRSFVRGSLARVKDASFVVVNPTHVAVALEYRPPRVPVPTVLVRAADGGALRVRELAARHRVPVIEDVPLARALFADARVGEPIAHAHYVAVAEIVASLQHIRESDS